MLGAGPAACGSQGEAGGLVLSVAREQGRCDAGLGTSAKHRYDGIVLDNCNSFGQLIKWRALLQARNTLRKGGQSATQMHAYSQYFFMVPIVVTVDFDARTTT